MREEDVLKIYLNNKMTPLDYDYNKLFSFLLGLVIAYLFFLVYRERKCICVCEKKDD
tara:strand:+ start:329 stop:499 length:171 start_codon:yes stop_codon:yes gene_type:complete